MLVDVKFKTVVVTGGSKGIGFSIAKIFSQYNKVIICSRSKKNLQNARKKILNAFPKANIEIFICDLLLNDDLNKFIDYLSLNFKKIDILINNLGGGGRWGNSNYIKNIDLTTQEIMQKNFYQIEKLTRFSLKKMVENNWGRVITISSIYSSQVGGRPIFSSSKKAAEVLMKCLSNDAYFAKKNITFNTIQPGAVYTQSWKKDPIGKKKVKKIIPSGKFGSTSDLARLIYYLSSDYCSHINGAKISYDGGESQFI